MTDKIFVYTVILNHYGYHRLYSTNNMKKAISYCESYFRERFKFKEGEYTKTPLKAPKNSIVFSLMGLISNYPYITVVREEVEIFPIDGKILEDALFQE